MASSSDQIIVAFDLYGTLLSTGSIAKELATHFGNERAADLADLWRRYQLEYTWRLNSMSDVSMMWRYSYGIADGKLTEKYQPFSTVTRNALKHILSESGLPLDNKVIETLMKAYDSLSTFPDVSPILNAIADAAWATPVVFSNGTNEMVRNSVYSSPNLGPHAPVFKNIVTVDDVRCFKPDPAVYYHLAERVGKSRNDMESMWLVSANPFDIVGARAVGMQAAWVNRKGDPWVDELIQDESLKPTVVVQDLIEIMNVLSDASLRSASIR